MSAELKLTFGWTGSSHDDDLVITVDPAPPPPNVSVKIELYLIDEAGDPAWIDVGAPFTRSDFLGTGSVPLLIEGAIDSSPVVVARTSSINDQYVQYNGGRLTFTLRNLNGEWDPLNASNPWWVAGKTLLTQGSKGTPVRVSITPPVTGADPVRIFTGRVTSWPPSYVGAMYSDVPVVASDGVWQLKATNLAKLASPVGGGSSAGFRINRALDNAGWDQTYDDIDETAVNTLQATVFKSDAWSEAQLAADSDLGCLWLNKNGGVTYRTRYHTIKATPALTFSMNAEAGTYLYDLGLVNSFDPTQTGNVVKQTRDKGNEQAGMTDDAATNGYASFSRSGLLMETDRQAMDTALHTAGAFRDVLFRPTRIPVSLTERDPAWVAMLAAGLFDITEVRQVTPHPPHVTARTLTSRVVNTGITWTLRPASRKFNLDIDTTIAPPVLPSAQVGTAKVGSSVAQFAGAAS